MKRLLLIIFSALAASAAADTAVDDLVIYSWQYDGVFRDGTEETIAVKNPGGNGAAIDDRISLGTHFGAVDAVLAVTGNATGFSFDAQSLSPFFSPPYVGGRTTLNVAHFFRKEVGQATLDYEVTRGLVEAGQPGVGGPGPLTIEATATYEVTLFVDCGGGGYCRTDPSYRGEVQLRGSSHVWKPKSTNRSMQWECVNCGGRTPQITLNSPYFIHVDLSQVNEQATFLITYKLVTTAIDRRQDIDGGSYAGAYFRDPLDPGNSRTQVRTSGLTQLPVPASVTLVDRATLLLETGQVACFDAAGNARACAGTGEDGDGPDPRFIAGSGAETDCVLDRATGLQWPKHFADAASDWSTGLARSEGLVLCGHDDWRLPNVNELESLINAGVGDQAAWLSSAGITGLDAAPLWTSTSAAGAPLSAWTVDLADGAVVDLAKTTSLRFLPVRR